MARSQLKLMAALAGLVVLVVSVSGVLAERGLHTREMERISRSLEERAALARELTAGLVFEPGSRIALDAVADRASRAAGARVTLMAPDGAVLGDSEVPLARLPAIENHAGRPEMRAALAGRVGRSTRRSGTVGRRLLYVALPVDGGAGGVVRVAMDLSDLESAVADLRRVLLVAGGIGLLGAIALSYGLSWLTLRPVREIQRLTAAVAAGDLDYRLPRRFGDELGEIAGSIHRMAEQLRERLAETTREKEQLQTMLNGMVEGVVILDPSSEIMLANDRMMSFFGVTGDVRGRSPLEVFRHSGLAEAIHAAQGADDPVGRTISLSHPVRRELRVQAVRFPPGPGPRLGTVAVLHDVTELSRLDTMRREFVANASHELRTPLAAIRGFAETLLGRPDLSHEERRSYLEVIDRHANRLGTLVGDLLELSRIESEVASFELEPVDLSATAETMIDESRTRCEEKRLEVAYEGSEPAVAQTDAGAVQQILSNLLDNAIQYTEPGGRVTVRVEAGEKRVRVTVTDTGIGIPRADLERIFERFYRVDESRSRAAGGTGLGLSIVKHLVQSLGGEITVSSELGGGSSFTFTLPRSD